MQQNLHTPHPCTMRFANLWTYQSRLSREIRSFLYLLRFSVLSAGNRRSSDIKKLKHRHFERHMSTGSEIYSLLLGRYQICLCSLLQRRSALKFGQNRCPRVQKKPPRLTCVAQERLGLSLLIWAILFNRCAICLIIWHTTYLFPLLLFTGVSRIPYHVQDC